MRLLISFFGGGVMAFSLLWFMASLIAKPLPAPTSVVIDRDDTPVSRPVEKRTVIVRQTAPLPPPAVSLPRGIRDGTGTRGSTREDAGPVIEIGPFTPEKPFEGIRPEWDPNPGSQTRLLSDSLLPMFQPAPQYPADALRQAQEGWVRLRIAVAPDGHVADAQVLMADPKRVFDRSAVAAVKNWRYRPRDSSITQTLEVEVAFTLEK